MRPLHLLFILLVVLGACVAADNTTGTSQSACTAYPTLAVGNGDNTCRAAINFYYAAMPTPTAIGTNGDTIVAGYMSHASLADDPNVNPIVFGTYAYCPTATSGTCGTPGPGGVYTVGVATINETTGAVVAGTPMPNTCTTTNGHNSAGLMQLGGGYIGIAFCALDTPVACGSTTGAAGSAEHCEYFMVGNCASTQCGANQGVNTFDVTATATPMALPVAGLSEMSSAKWANNLLIGGQVQHQWGATALSPYSGGMQGYMSLNLSPTSPGTVTVDTACTQQTGATPAPITQYNPRTTAITSACWGGQAWSQSVHDDDVWVLQITNNAASGTVQMVFPAVASYTGGTCQFTTSGTNATDTASIVTEINAGTLPTTISGDCTHTGTVYTAAVVTNVTGNFTGCTAAGAGACVVLMLTQGDPTGLTFTGATCGASTTCTTANGAGNNGGGIHQSFAWGGPRMLVNPYNNFPYWVELYANNFNTNWSSGALYSSAAGNAMSFMIFCANAPPINGVWIWGDATSCGNGRSDGFSFPMSPALTNAVALRGGAGAGGSCTAGSTCQEYVGQTLTNVPNLVQPCGCSTPAGMLPFNYNWSSASQAAIAHAPIFTEQDIAFDRNGNLGIAYACNTTSANHRQLCYITVNTTTGQTTQQVFIDSTFSLDTLFTVALNVTPAGNLVAELTQSDGASCSGCSTGGNILEYISTNNGATWSRGVYTSYGGTNLVQASCNIFDITDGTHIYNICLVPGGTAGSAVFKLLDLYIGGT